MRNTKRPINTIKNAVVVMSLVRAMRCLFQRLVDPTPKKPALHRQTLAAKLHGVINQAVFAIGQLGPIEEHCDGVDKIMVFCTHVAFLRGQIILIGNKQVIHRIFGWPGYFDVAHEAVARATGEREPTDAFRVRFLLVEDHRDGSRCLGGIIFELVFNEFARRHG